jgi:hypothetical protein
MEIIDYILSGDNFFSLVNRRGNTISLTQQGSQTAKNKNRKMRGSSGSQWATPKATK